MTAMESSKLRSFERNLKARIRGKVSFDAFARGLYATDASIYQVQPVAGVLPLDEADVKAAVETAAEYTVSIIPRGGGTSLGGQAVGEAMVVDFSKTMNQIIEVNAEQRWVRVQPGIVRDNLNAALAEHGLHFAPDPATSSRATVGGMIGNNSSGTKSIVFGKTVDHVLETKVLLSDGEILEFKKLTPEQYTHEMASKGRKAEILGRFRQIIEANREEIEARYPKVMRRVGGYNLDEFIHTDQWNLSKLIVGSEGTLATLLEAKINLEPLLKHTVLCVVQFASLQESIKAVTPILAHKPSAVEIFDKVVLELARKNLSIAPLCDFVEGNPEAILFVEFFGDSPEEAENKVRTMIADIRGQGLGYAYPIQLTPEEQDRVWTVRKNGLGLMLGMRGNRRPIPFIEDTCVPVDVLLEYVDRVIGICKKHETELAMYAHTSVGTIHFRPILDLKKQSDIERMKAIANEVFELVKSYGGSWSSEHGDGRVRSAFVERFFGSQLYGAFKQVKQLFDPRGLMNPGDIVEAPQMDQHLRYGTAYRTPVFPTQFHYRQQGSFASAVEFCTGIGTCRQTLIGTMCPSYRVTRDEEHSTRGRANALRLAMTGQLGPDALTDMRLFDILDFCLSCKSCKSECPSNVDLARLKSEFLQIYHDRHGLSLRDQFLWRSVGMARFFSGWKAPLVNWIQKTLLFRVVLEKLAGIDRRRFLPDYASEPFHRWFENHSKKNAKIGNRVVLFDDTYVNYYEPNVGISAVQLLESCGYEVILARAGCCQRVLISHGFLRDAKREGEKTLRALDEYIQQGLKVVVCEPSCASALTDDLPDLIDDEALGRRISENVMMIDVFLASEIQSGRLNCDFVSPLKRILLHGHCHQKSLYGTTAMKKILAKVANLSMKEVDSGCCGMAGSFGYEREHYDLSLQIGEERLFPAIRNKDEETSVVACGFSCRHQILDAIGIQPLHWVETVRGRM
jgi:FAD/FMN-containing dehydrogenase/Fe-S oxidoreductase